MTNAYDDVPGHSFVGLFMRNVIQCISKNDIKSRLSNVISIDLKNFFNSIKLMGSYNKTALRSS